MTDKSALEEMIKLIRNSRQAKGYEKDSWLYIRQGFVLGLEAAGWKAKDVDALVERACDILDDNG